jgi:hypothetical protein
MAPIDRSQGRDVHIYDVNDPNTVIGGLILTNGVTKNNFYLMVEILVLFTSNFELRHEDDTKVERNDDPLQLGKYYIHATGKFLYVILSCLANLVLWVGPFSVNNEPWLVRTISHSTGTRVKSFCDAVRSRDRQCVISGEKAVGAHLNRWRGFEAAHIFPLAYESHWTEHGYDRWITIPLENGGTINSVQNGLLLESAVHQLFDSYDLSINPDV